MTEEPPADVKFCPYCGTVLKDRACQTCGTAATTVPRDDHNEKVLAEMRASLEMLHRKIDMLAQRPSWWDRIGKTIFQFVQWFLVDRRARKHTLQALKSVNPIALTVEPPKTTWNAEALIKVFQEISKNLQDSPPTIIYKERPAPVFPYKWPSHLKSIQKKRISREPPKYPPWEAKADWTWRPEQYTYLSKENTVYPPITTLGTTQTINQTSQGTANFYTANGDAVSFTGLAHRETGHRGKKVVK